ncbi:unnamed protein product [Durusdinium trenchii]|uniref:Cyclic nucleotide-binding domain-containing protein n=1 Tax=Durusdinium trenchii TaxID=1381693 RepID=A0ABP0PKZ7_9DINO
MQPRSEFLCKWPEKVSEDELQAEPAGKVLLTRRGGISAEPSGAYNVCYADWTQPVHPKTQEQRQSLSSALQKCPLFQGIDAEDLSKLVDAMEILRVKADEKIYTKGESGTILLCSLADVVAILNLEFVAAWPMKVPSFPHQWPVASPYHARRNNSDEHWHSLYITAQVQNSAKRIYGSAHNKQDKEIFFDPYMKFVKYLCSLWDKYDNVVAVELLNEPPLGGLPNLCYSFIIWRHVSGFFGDVLEVLNADPSIKCPIAIANFGSAAPASECFFSCLSLAGFPSHTKKQYHLLAQQNRLIFSFHYYVPPLTASFQQTVDAAKQFATDTLHGAPLWLSEFFEDCPQKTADQMAMAVDLGINAVTYWNYADTDFTQQPGWFKYPSEVLGAGTGEPVNTAGQIDPLAFAEHSKTVLAGIHFGADITGSGGAQKYVLELVPMFETFDDELIARITDIVEKRKYSSGSKIIVQGQKIVRRGQKPIEGQTVPAELYIVLSGECAVTIWVDQVGSDKAELEEHEVRRYGPGERFGELAFINRTDRAASVTAVTDTELLCLDRDTFERLEELELKQRENYACDPRKALADFYSPGDQHGPGGVAQTPGETQWFAVYRPTSRDALAKMLNQTAVGKGLNVKGKSAKKNYLSGFVPFLQISVNEHKEQIGPPQDEASVTVYYQSRESQEAALKELQRAEAWKEMSPVYEDNSYPGVYGLVMSEDLLREVYIDTPDIQFRAGWETGRASEPAFMDMNLHALRSESSPRVVLYQYDATNELNPHGLLVAYAEEYEARGKQIRSVKPVVSDFDTFTIGSIGMSYEALPDEQLDLMVWSLQQAKGILSKPGKKSWNSRWLEVLQKANQEGFHPSIPPYGFGDPTSYRLIEEVIKATAISGAVRHGAECFNFYFPQEFDAEYLVVWHGLPGKPWAYYDPGALQKFLMERIEEGFSFPINPVWPVRDPGWYEIFSALLRREDAKKSLKAWFPPHRSVVECIESIHEAFPQGFQTTKAENDDLEPEERADLLRFQAKRRWRKLRMATRISRSFSKESNSSK